MITLGANTVLFGDHDLRTAMECIKRAGYDAAEISALGGMANHLPLDDWRSSAAVRSSARGWTAFDSRQVTLCSCSVPRRRSAASCALRIWS